MARRDARWARFGHGPRARCEGCELDLCRSRRGAPGVRADRRARRHAGYARRGTIEEVDGDAVERMFDTNAVALKTGYSRSPGKPGSSARLAEVPANLLA